MYKEILVPLDGSRFAEYALPTALSVAERSGGRIRLVSAVTDVPPLPLVEHDEGTVRGWFDEARSRASEYLDDAAAQLRETESALEVETKVLMGPAVRMLTEEIEKRPPDLVIMTTHGRGPLQRAWVGSVTDGLLRRANRPLLLVRPKPKEEANLDDRPAFQKMLIPMDGSEEAEAVLSPASELGQLFGSSITLFTVVPELFAVGSSYLPHLVEEQEEQKKRRASFQRYLDELKTRVPADAVRTRTVVGEGEDVASGIIDAAIEEKSDLIAMATHGRSGVARLVLGSVADKVIRGSTVPVLVFRSPEKD